MLITASVDFVYANLYSPIMFMLVDDHAEETEHNYALVNLKPMYLIIIIIK